MLHSGKRVSFYVFVIYTGIRITVFSATCDLFVKRLILFIAAGAVLFFAAYRFLNARFVGSEVEVVQPTRGPAVEAVYATGTVEGTVMLPIAPRTGARLVSLEAFEGDEVKAGQILARLESEELEQAVVELTAREELAEKESKRQEALRARNATSQEAFERARAELAAVRAAKQAAEVQAGYLTLRAPADSLIIRRDGEVGEFIPTNQAIFWLVCCGPLRITAEVDEEDVVRVKPGQKVLIRADAFPDAGFEGSVQSITPKGDPVARTYRVRISLAEDTPLRIGMTAENNIIVRKADNALLVPSTAVFRNSLWLVENGVLKQAAVEVGARGAEQTEILSGIGEESLIVASPLSDFSEGSEVSVRLRE